MPSKRSWVVLFILGLALLLVGSIHSTTVSAQRLSLSSARAVNPDGSSIPPLEKVSLQLIWKHQFEFAGFYAAIEKAFTETGAWKSNYENMSTVWMSLMRCCPAGPPTASPMVA
jgi:hypothetical protein